jgi:hypothetical protein
MREEVFIIGGGPSLKNFDFLKLADKDTIVVNKSILHVPFPSYFITVDYTVLGKIGIQSFKQVNTTKIFVANFSIPTLKEADGVITDTKFNLAYENLTFFDRVIKSHKSDGIGLSFDDFRSGSNSGFCAFQLAVLLGYKKIYLLGIDLDTSNNITHYHGGYGEGVGSFDVKLKDYFMSFKAGLLQLSILREDIKVFNCSITSALNYILPYKSVEEIL